MRSRLAVHILLLSAILSLGMIAAWAHAIVLESSPQANAVVRGPVLEIKLRFNERIDGARSRLTLVNPDSTSHPVDVLQQGSPDALAAMVSGLLPGKYRLHWQVLAGDGHITEGDIPFSVAAP